MSNLNPLSSLNPDESILDLFDSITVGEGIAKESKKPYRYIKMTLINGEEIKCFLSPFSYYPFRDALEKARS